VPPLSSRLAPSQIIQRQCLQKKHIILWYIYVLLLTRGKQTSITCLDFVRAVFILLPSGSSDLVSKTDDKITMSYQLSFALSSVLTSRSILSWLAYVVPNRFLIVSIRLLHRHSTATLSFPISLFRPEKKGEQNHTYVQIWLLSKHNHWCILVQAKH
jgi:hypothetical protein